MTAESRDDVRLSDVTLPELRRALITAALLLTVLYLFLGMVGRVLLAGVLGVVVGIYLIPIADWVGRRVGSLAVGAVAALALLLAPVVAVVAYGYAELERAAAYLSDHATEVAAEIHQALARVPFLDGVAGRDAIESAVRSAAEMGSSLPAEAQGLLGGFLVGVGIFLFTAFYVTTERDEIVDYLQGSIPARYAELAGTLEANARGVLYGTIFAVLVTQALKAATLLVLFLIFGVPLPVTLAVVAFFVGFFPIVGSWTLYVPAAGYLLVFRDSPGQAAILLAAGFLITTAILSFYVRPKLAADRSGVLNFYWMFLGLVAGVYAFGLPGVVVGPLLIGLLKAITDTVRGEQGWTTRVATPGDDEPEPEVLAEEELEG